MAAVKLPVCVCAAGKIAAQHTLDVHDPITGECRYTDGATSCPCVAFRDSGRTVTVQGG